MAPATQWHDDAQSRFMADFVARGLLNRLQLTTGKLMQKQITAQAAASRNSHHLRLNWLASCRHLTTDKTMAASMPRDVLYCCLNSDCNQSAQRATISKHTLPNEAV
eukprot:5620168-Pleurochrysis_carterae.AAC.4